MKLRFVICWAILLCLTHTLARAQSITLDSLWGKFVGNINAMVFTPDSKSILIGNDEHQLVRYNALTGDTISIIPTLYGAQECIFTKEGNKLFVRGFKGIEIKDAVTFQTLDSLPIPTKEHDFASFDINNDGSVIAVKSHVWDSKEVFYWEIAVYNNSTKQTVWSVKTKGALGTNSRYPEGKIALTPDGNYVLGQNSFFLCKWNWRDSIQPGEILIENIPNLELISFSPDRNYFVLKSNHLYDIRLKQELIIDGLGQGSVNEYAFRALFTSDNRFAIVSKDYNVYFVDILLKKSFLTKVQKTGRAMAISNESALLATSYGKENIIVNKIDWLTKITGDELSDNEFSIAVVPSITSNKNIIKVYTNKDLNKVEISISNTNGNIVTNIYQGFVPLGETEYILTNQSIASGIYYVNCHFGTHVVSKPFIITK
ncbi:MAG: hypothetical protein K1X91_17450 [Bacteriodetes bacterium]|nr:hypothetical protein [Bacteroidota bacterium]